MKSKLAYLLSISLLGTFSSTYAALITTETIADTYIRSDQSERSFGSDTSLIVGNISATSFSHGLFKFSLTDSALIGQTISSVSLVLTTTANDGGSSTSYTLNLYQLSSANSGWIEGTTTATPSSGQSTWQKMNATATSGAINTGTNWAGSQGASTSGTDYLSPLLSSVTGNPQTTTAGTTLTMNSSASFVSAVQDAIGGEISFFLGNDVGERDFFRIASRDNATYAGATLVITTIPEPSTMLLVTCAAAGLIIFRIRRRSTRTLH